MQVLAAFLLASVLIGGTRLGGHIRRRPVIHLAMTTVVAASFYSLRVVL